MKKHERHIALVDCNNFFVSCERIFDPTLDDQPTIVLSSNDSCAIARSQEAKDLGIKMGEPWFKKRHLPELKDMRVLSSNFNLYSHISDSVIAELSNFTPLIENYSVDESFLDLTGFTDVRQRAYAIKETIWHNVRIPVCVGIGPTKTLSKLANFVAKKHPKSKGVFIYNELTTHQQDSLLSSIPIEEVWGVGRQHTKSLNAMGIYSVRELRDSHIPSMRKKYSVVMERTINELRGIACIDFEFEAPPKKEIIQSRSFGRLVSDIHDLENVIARYISRVAQKLRKQDSVASQVHVFLLTDYHRDDLPQYHPHITLSASPDTNNTLTLNELAMQGLHAIYQEGYQFKKGGVGVSGIKPVAMGQTDLFADPKKEKLMQAMDAINDRFGPGTLTVSQDLDNAHREGWRTKTNFISPNYLSDIADVPVCS